ncbi:MAG TPA: response regulator [Candidatus Binatia bacterium]|nr:response regulator [Candidatus Binatia bacterium]
MPDQCNVLLVDDSEDDVYLLKRALAHQPNMRVVAWAEDGSVAIDYLSGAGPYADRKQHPWPDLMVLDLKMPRRDGYQVLEWLRGKSPRPKVAVFTASDLEQDKTRVSQLGADLYQHKAFQAAALDQFMNRLQALCGTSTAS